MAKYSIDKLAEESGIDRRTIRYYIQEGVLQKPAGTGKSAYYTEQHLQRLKAIQQGTGAGMKLGQLRLADRDQTPALIPSGAQELLLQYQNLKNGVFPDATLQRFLKIEIAPGIELTISDDVMREKSINDAILHQIRTAFAQTLSAFGL